MKYKQAKKKKKKKKKKEIQTYLVNDGYKRPWCGLLSWNKSLIKSLLLMYPKCNFILI